MNLSRGLILPLFSALLISCSSSQVSPEITILKDSTKKDTVTDRYNLDSILTSYLSNKVELDSFFRKITHQEKVKVIANLSENYNDTTDIYTYSSKDYEFKLKVLGEGPFPEKEEANTILYDGKHKISFDKYKVTCFSECNCERYAFNIQNTLQQPQIIEVCGKRFLYSNMNFACNGIGCGCSFTMIYDIETKHPTFIEGYRTPFPGYYLSDFDNDNNPDVVIIELSENLKMTGFNTSDFTINLYAYRYDHGKFKLYINNQFQEPYSLQLYGIGVYRDYTGRELAIIVDKWFKQ